MAETSIPGEFPNPNTLPSGASVLSTELSSTFDLGNDEDRDAVWQEAIEDIEYNTMFSREYEFDPSTTHYYMDSATGLYSAYPIFKPAYTYEDTPGVQGYLVALLIKCTKGSCVLINDGGNGKSIQYLPYPMHVGDFLFWADPHEPLVGINEDGSSDSILGLLGIKAATDVGVRLSVYSFYRFVEKS